MAGETRIDIVSGQSGAGKTAFIRQLLQCASGVYDVALYRGALNTGRLEGRTPCFRPKRILLEAEGDSLFEEALGPAISGRAAYYGVRVAVIDARRFRLSEREEERIGEATHVFLNRTVGLDCAVRSGMLKAIWEINPRVNILVDPLDGLNLWSILDSMPAAR